jgi:phospholipase/carboxylesterase
VQQPLGGILALSAYLPLGETLDAEKSAANARVPIFMAHGSDDPIVPLRFAVASRASLEARGYAVEWHEYPMAHAVCAAEIVAVAKWLTARADERA